MTNCRNMEELMATSLYEALAPQELDALQSHLSGCVACREEFTSLQAFVGQLTPVPVTFEGDLLPTIREELRRTERRSWFSGWQPAFIGVCVFIVVCSFFAYVIVDSQGRGTEKVAMAQPADGPLADARRLTDSGDPAGALKLLKAALEAVPGGIDAGRLQLEVAELEYGHFHRYEAAYNAYRAVRDTQPEAWTQSSGIVKERFDLLFEARDANFEPLYQIDAALKQGESGVPALEQVMARYPGRFVAQAAMETMLAMADGEGLDRLEQARSRCTNPVALAQLDVRLGEGYCKGNLDPAKGKALLHAVADSPYSVPAQMAKDVLARLEAGEVR